MTILWEGPHSGRTIEDLTEIVESAEKRAWLKKRADMEEGQDVSAGSFSYSRIFPDSDPEDAQAMADGIQAEHERGNG